MPLNNSQLRVHAMELVKAGLSSGAVKLLGSNSGEYNEIHAAADVKYLNTLINGITENLINKRDD